MTQNQHVRKVNFLLHPLLFVMALLTLAVAEPALALCDNATVTNQTELEAAIVDYNANCGNGDTLTATVDGTITYAAALTAMNNSTTAGMVIQDGTLDADSNGHVLLVLDGNVTFENMLLTGGTGPNGGAIQGEQDTNVTLINSTVTGNASITTAAILNNGGTLTLTNTTVSNNEIAAANNSLGSVWNRINVSTPILNLNNSIIANTFDTNGASVADCRNNAGTVNFSAGQSNLIELDQAGGAACDVGGANILTGDALLAALADNGGSVQTMALLAGSLAINAGDNTAASTLTFDARGTGFPRNVSGTVDLGAFENQQTTEVQFVAATGSGAESVANPTILTITTSDGNNTVAPITIELAVGGGTLTDDYTVTTPFTIPAGTASGTPFAVPGFAIVNDTDEELDEELTLTLSNPSGAILGTNTAIAYTIEDDDNAPPMAAQLTPADDSTNVAVNQNLIIEFDENVAAGTGNITLFSGTPQELFNDPLDDASQLTVTTGNFGVDLSFGPPFTHFGVNDGAGGGDYGGDTPSDRVVYNGFDGGYLEAYGLASLTNPSVVEWQNIDVTGATQLQFSADFASALQPDLADSVTIEAIIDAGTPEQILLFNSSTNNGVFRLDGTAIELTDTAQNFRVPITGTGSSLTIRATLSLSASTSTGDDIAIDNVIITGSGLGTSTLVEQVTASDGNVNIVDKVLTFDPTTDLDGLTDYYVTVDAGAVTDTSPNTNNFVGLLDSEWNFTTDEKTAPTLLTLNPVDGATNVAVTTNLVLTFDEGMQVGTGNIELRETAGDALVESFDAANSGLISFSTTTVTNDTVTINPTADLAELTEYYLLIPATALTDDSTNANQFAGLTATTDWSFTTGDFTPPQVLTFDPLDDALKAPFDTDLTLTFDEDIQTGSGTVTIFNASDDSVFETIVVPSGQMGTAAKVVGVNPTANLGLGQSYYVQISAGAITDTATTPNAFAGITDATTWNFTTDDGDGLDPATEDQAPNDGDGNNDGIPDRQQANVASFPSLVDGCFLTLTVPEGILIANPQAVAVPPDAPQGIYTYPCNMIEFTLTGMEEGASVAVELFVHPVNLGISVYHKFNNTTGQWDNIAEAIETVGDATHIQFILTDGGPYDADGSVNSAIQDPSGPAFIFAPMTEDIPTLQHWGLILLVSGLGFIVTVLVRRKQK